MPGTLPVDPLAQAEAIPRADRLRSETLNLRVTPGQRQLVALLAARNNEPVARTAYRLFVSALEREVEVLADVT